MPPKLSYMALPVDPSFACIDDEAEEGGETEDDEEEDAAEVGGAGDERRGRGVVRKGGWTRCSAR